MQELGYAESFRDLLVYQKERILAGEIFELTRGFPKDETYSLTLTDQTRRSSRPIGAQVAEAWAKRRHERHFISNLTDADAEQLETQHWIDSAGSCDYLTPVQTQTVNQKLSEIGKRLNSMIFKADQFCKNN